MIGEPGASVEDIVSVIGDRFVEERLEAVQSRGQPLVTWGEIAEHLHVSIRTAQYWERERGLPIYRRGDGSRSRVFAYPSELDRWRLVGTPKPSKHLTLIWPTSLLGLVLLSVALVVAFYPFSSTSGLARAEIRDGMLRAFSGDGTVLWERYFPNASQRTFQVVKDVPIPKEPLLVLADINRDERDELIFLHLRADELAESGEILCFNAAGQEVWRFVPGRELSVTESPGAPPRVFAGAFSPRINAIFGEYLIGSARHNTFYPTQNFLLDLATGELICDYWHPGHIDTTLLVDLDGDGREELILSGTNNPGTGVGHAVILAFHLPFDRRPIGLRDFLETQYGPYKYVLMNRPDVVAVQPGIMTGGHLAQIAPGRIVCKVGGRFGSLTYTFDYDLNLLHFTPADMTRLTHFDFFMKGMLDHNLTDREIASWGQTMVLDATPDGNDPALEQSFNEIHLRVSREGAVDLQAEREAGP